MSQFTKYKSKSPGDFTRLVGVSPTTFAIIFKKLEAAIEKFHSNEPIRKRGRKSSLELSDQLLLTFLYLRQYDTFLNLGAQFGISESYAQKRFTFISSLLLKALDLPDEGNLNLSHIQILAVDVTEQPIERPLKDQKKYYSGKKNDIQLKH
jgi:Helix-turn-helix of DDE superfamily endonuclease